MEPTHVRLPGDFRPHYDEPISAGQVAVVVIVFLACLPDIFRDVWAKWKGKRHGTRGQ